MKSMVWGKFVGLAVVLLLLLLGLGQITDLVQERQSQRTAATENIARSLAGSQTLLGPLVHMACTEEWQTRNDSGHAKTERREFTRVAPPANLALDGTSQLEPRGRGLYTAQVFTLKANIRAHWPDLNALQFERQHADSRINCGPALLALAVSDARGIQQAVLKVNGAPSTVRSGTFFGTHPRGVHAALPTGLDLAAPLDVQLELVLLGTERFGIIPMEGDTQMHLTSNWPHPSFDGQFLPVEREITAQGFDANWKISSLASSTSNDATFGVTFIDPSNTYALSHRATHYGLLFIALTFASVGLFEIMRSLRVHPVQYFLVGAAISVFFLLLVSLSEHMAFGVAYAIAATGCVLLLTWYASHMLSSWQRGLPFGAGIAALYGLLFVLLRLEQTALLVGAIALFLVLALVMSLTRKVDWYAQLNLQACKDISTHRTSTHDPAH